MSVEVGTVTINYLDLASPEVDDFISTLSVAAEQDEDGMAGYHRALSGFTQRQMLELRDAHFDMVDPEPAVRGAINGWIVNLPWDGWCGDCAENYKEKPHLEGGFIELFFWW